MHRRPETPPAAPIRWRGRGRPRAVVEHEAERDGGGEVGTSGHRSVGREVGVEVVDGSCRRSAAALADVGHGHLVRVEAAARVVLLERRAPAPRTPSRVCAGSLVVSISAPSVSSATPTMPVMFTPRSPRAVATRASEPGLSSSWTVNQTVTAAPPHASRWYRARAAASPCLHRPSPDQPRPAIAAALRIDRLAARPQWRPMPRPPRRARPSSSSARGLAGDPRRAAVLQERRVDVQFVDLRRRPIAPGELRRFVERLGAAACADRTAGRGATPASATCG